MADLKIDEIKAVAWVTEVQQKLTAVEATLREVRQVRSDTVGSEDTVFQMIEKASNLMDETWTKTSEAFKRGWGALKDGLGTLKKAGQQIGEAFDELQAKI